MSEINPNNLIKVRLGADNAIRVISSFNREDLKLSDLNDVNNLSGIPNNSVLVYNSSTEQWNPYSYIDGGTY